MTCPTQACAMTRLQSKGCLQELHCRRPAAGVATPSDRTWMVRSCQLLHLVTSPAATFFLSFTYGAPSSPLVNHPDPKASHHAVTRPSTTRRKAATSSMSTTAFSRPTYCGSSWPTLRFRPAEQQQQQQQRQIQSLVVSKQQQQQSARVLVGQVDGTSLMAPHSIALRHTLLAASLTCYAAAAGLPQVVRPGAHPSQQQQVHKPLAAGGGSPRCCSAGLQAFDAQPYAAFHLLQCRVCVCGKGGWRERVVLCCAAGSQASRRLPW